jgi:predicted nucleotidyltransferase
MVGSERAGEIVEVVDRVTRWAARHDDVVAVALVGSCARGAIRPDSDVDVVLLTTDIDVYEGNSWTGELRLGRLVRVQQWGLVVERRFVTNSGLEVEINIGGPNWADPAEPGTVRVVRDGVRVLFDPAGLLAALLGAVVDGAARSGGVGQEVG